MESIDPSISNSACTSRRRADYPVSDLRRRRFLIVDKNQSADTIQPYRTSISSARRETLVKSSNREDSVRISSYRSKERIPMTLQNVSIFTEDSHSQASVDETEEEPE